MSVFKSLVVFGCIFCLVIVAASANDIKVENMEALRRPIPETVAEVKFDISWENSWSNDLNWDAAWVFVKFRAPGSSVWQHAILSTDASDHVAPANAVIAPASDGRGVFVHGGGAYTGAVDYAGIRLTWDYGSSGYDFAAGDIVDIAVHAVEMGYVPEGPFYLGSGSTESYSFTDGSWTSGAAIPFQITNENALSISHTAGDLWATGNDRIRTGTLPAAYPKGYDAYYCMKYSISQGQYAAFLNTLTSTQAGNRFSNQFGNNRHMIRFDGDSGSYIAEAPDRACNYLSWADGAAYADWAGLRPMTELEYEKACRGFSAPLTGEYAWGTVTITGQTGHSGVDGSGVETALPTTANANLTYESLLGPVRGGIYAIDGATRVAAGASFWGIMELSGNVWQSIVSAGNANGCAFEGTHGDGEIDAAGNANAATWPAGTGAGTRGIAPHINAWHLKTSSRYDATAPAGRSYMGGWRAVRTAQ